MGRKRGVGKNDFPNSENYKNFRNPFHQQHEGNVQNSREMHTSNEERASNVSTNLVYKYVVAVTSDPATSHPAGEGGGASSSSLFCQPPRRTDFFLNSPPLSPISPPSPDLDSLHVLLNSSPLPLLDSRFPFDSPPLPFYSTITFRLNSSPLLLFDSTQVFPVHLATFKYNGCSATLVVTEPPLLYLNRNMEDFKVRSVQTTDILATQGKIVVPSSRCTIWFKKNY